MKYMQKLFTHLSVFFLATFAVIAYAAPGTYPNILTYDDGSGIVDSIPRLLLALVDLVFLIGVPIVVLSIIYSGFLFVTAGDNESKSTKARFVFTWTMIGALILFGAKAIALAIQTTVLSLGS